MNLDPLRMLAPRLRVMACGLYYGDMIFLQGHPQLQQLTLAYDYNFGPWPAALLSTLSQLTDLAMADHHVQGWAADLAACTNLTSLTLNCSGMAALVPLYCL